MLFDDFIDLLHQADRASDSSDYFLVMSYVVRRQSVALAVLEPLVTDLIATYTKVPYVLRHAVEAT